MTNQEIVSKLWNLCNVLRDDGAIDDLQEAIDLLQGVVNKLKTLEEKA